MTEPASVEAALALAALGWPVFPAQLELPDGTIVPMSEATADMKLKKVPIGDLVGKGFLNATTKPRLITLWWRIRPDAAVGVAMPSSTVALDVDILEEFEAAGLEMPEGHGQQTIRGGYHRFWATDGRRVRQTVKEVPGADTRVGGRGYVVAWDPDAFPNVADLMPAPEWIYDGESEPAGPAWDGSGTIPVRRSGRKGRTVEVATFQVGERDNALARFAGTMRKAGAGPDAIYAAMKAMLENGQIESPREDPVTDKDLRRIAGSIGTRQSDAVDKERRPGPERYMANDLRKQTFDPLHYFVDELVPEGLGIIGGASKIGKSWMVLQAAMEIADGTGTFLDRAVNDPKPVLYYALEDGPRRANARMEALAGFHPLNTTWLEFRFEAPMLGEGLEEDIERFVVDNEGGIVFVDVLARVQPEQRGRGSAYNADYTMLKETHEVVKRIRKNHEFPAAVVFVTHLRKQGAEDPYAMLQGTTGIMGSSDWTWVIMRKRMEAKGSIQVTGRDISKEPFVEAVFNGAWTAVGTTHRGGTTQRNYILDALLTEGDMTTAQIRSYINESVLTADETPFTDNSVNEKLNAMKEGGLVEQTATYVKGKGGGYVWHAFSEDEIQAVGQANKAVAAAAEQASGHGRAIPVRRTSSRVREGEGARSGAHEDASPQAPQAPHPDLQPMEPVEGVEGSLPRRRTRAPAHTRSGVS